MPSTASFIAQDRKYRGRKRYPYLYRPELNLELGQKYIEYLLEEGIVEGDLFRMTTAWNAGPGNLQKWYRQWHAKQDGRFGRPPYFHRKPFPCARPGTSLNGY